MLIKVLLVEDQTSFIFEQMLAMHNGFEFIKAGDGAEAVRLAMRRDYDIILMDVMLPEMDGLTAIKLIREQKPDVPIVAMSGSNYANLAVQAGANEFILKPADFGQLSLLLTRLTMEHRASKLTESQTGEVQFKLRRLFKLKEQAAVSGINTPPEVIIEIEDLEADLENL